MKLSEQISQAAKKIQNGEIVAFPTETVYGLGADAFSVSAIKKIYKVKGRPQNNPLIAHIENRKQLNTIARSIPPYAETLMDSFWPGPLTILFPKRSALPDIVTAGLDTVAVRMPAHPIALQLIQQAKTPIVAPSANISGTPSPTHHNHVRKDFGDSVFCIEGGATTIGIESTIISLQDPQNPTILRAGAISKEDLEAVLGIPVSLATHTDDIPLSPGMKYRHYAPKAKLILANPDEFQSKLDTLAAKYAFVGVLASNQLIRSLTIHDNVLTQPLGDRTNPAELSRNLFRRLHSFDETHVTHILAETFPATGIGYALMDKLTRASEG